ncbi:hypothetical protein [Shimia thalassica]|uniref:hypothetical protein n=1 Tax=Shimia thalassica TaxID=1715693 RepID=UPI0027334531|nr:hypothetical protein [Shimia thalassica]MDP2518815.1 hypothetical protein [Shimia thalassica]
MKLPLVGLAALVSLLGFANPLLAKDELWQCDIVDGKEGTWIPQVVVFAFLDDGQTTLVADSVIMHFEKEPAVVSVKDRGRKLQMHWKLNGARDSWGKPVSRFGYTANYNKETRKIWIAAKPGGMPQAFSGKGTCATLKNTKSVEQVFKEAARIKQK